jgi:hypothetical protein
LELYNLQANAKRTGMTLGPIPARSNLTPAKCSLVLLEYWPGSLLEEVSLILNIVPILILSVQDIPLSSK